MIKVDNIEVFNFESAFRGLRNPMNSWDKSDSSFGVFDEEQQFDESMEVAYTYMEEEPQDLEEYAEYEMKLNALRDRIIDQGRSHYFRGNSSSIDCAFIGQNDMNLATKMVKAGTDESKFLRQIFVTMDVTAPLYWWKEADTYKVGTVANSTSTMHKITSEPITRDLFSFDDEDFNEIYLSATQDDAFKVNTLINGIIAELELLRSKYIETKDKRYWRAMIQILPCSWNQKRTLTLNYQVLRNIYFARRHHKLEEWKQFCRVIESLPYAAQLITVEKEK